MKSSRIIAFSSILSALSVVLLFLGSATQILDLSCAALASIAVVFTVIEFGGIWPYLIYAVTSVLSLILLPDKFAAIVYTAFAGYYPMIKLAVEKLRRLPVEWLIKTAVFNAALSVIIAASRFVFHIPDETVAFTWIVYAVSNAVFILFDIALSRLITLYMVNLRHRLKFFKR